MDSKLISEVRERLIKSGVATPDQIIGCTPNEVQEIEAFAQGRLPCTYKMFLLAMGREAGGFFEGTDIFYPQILDIRQEAEELLSEDESSYTLLDSDFVFASHQGYQFMYFNISPGDDDPPVFYYMEGRGLPEKKYSSFSEFLLGSVIDYETLITP